MKKGSAMGVDWETYQPRRGAAVAPRLAWPDDVADASQTRMPRMIPASGPVRVRGAAVEHDFARDSAMPVGTLPALVPKAGGPMFDVHGVSDSGDASFAMMRSLRQAIALHSVNAERAHVAALQNPMQARHDVEMQLRSQETRSRSEAAARRLMSEGGLKRQRRLRVADESQIGLFGMQPNPPSGRRPRKGRRPRLNDSLATGSSTNAPALQPMPRFMGAGPVANGSLLRSRVSPFPHAPPPRSLHSCAAGTV